MTGHSHGSPEGGVGRCTNTPCTTRSSKSVFSASSFLHSPFSFSASVSACWWAQSSIRLHPDDPAINPNRINHLRYAAVPSANGSENSVSRCFYLDNGHFSHLHPTKPNTKLSVDIGLSAPYHISGGPPVTIPQVLGDRVFEGVSQNRLTS